MEEPLVPGHQRRGIFRENDLDGSIRGNVFIATDIRTALPQHVWKTDAKEDDQEIPSALRQRIFDPNNFDSFHSSCGSFLFWQILASGLMVEQPRHHEPQNFVEQDRNENSFNSSRMIPSVTGESTLFSNYTANARLI